MTPAAKSLAPHTAADRRARRAGTPARYPVRERAVGASDAHRDLGPPTLSDVRGRSLPGDTAAEFTRAIAGLREARLRPEVRLAEVPAPQRIAPHAVALSGEVVGPGGEEELASGRFVLLHDPSCPEPWEGAWRAVTFARAELEPEVGTDPSLGEVGWAWLIEALQARGLRYCAEAGTVTRVVSERFGGLADQLPTVEIEVRASWTPLGGDLGDHLLAWSDLLSTIAGLPPLPDGVVALPGARR